MSSDASSRSRVSCWRCLTICFLLRFLTATSLAATPVASSVHHELEKKRQDLIPYPRMGRSSNSVEKLLSNIAEEEEDITPKLSNFPLSLEAKGQFKGKAASAHPTRMIFKQEKHRSSIFPDASMPASEYMVPYPRPGRAEENRNEPDTWMIPLPRFGRSDETQLWKTNPSGSSDMLLPYPRFGKMAEYADEDLGQTLNVELIKRMDLVPYPRLGREEGSDPNLFITPYPRLGRQTYGSLLPTPRLGRGTDEENLFSLRSDDLLLPFPSLGMAESDAYKRSIDKSLDATLFNDLEMHPHEEERSTDLLLPYPRLGRRSEELLLPYPRLGRTSYAFHNEETEKEDAQDLTKYTGSSYLTPYPRLGKRNSEQLTILPYPRLGRSDNTYKILQTKQYEKLLGLRPDSYNTITPYPRLGKSFLSKPTPGRTFLKLSSDFLNSHGFDNFLAKYRVGRSENEQRDDTNTNNNTDSAYENNDQTTLIPYPRFGRSGMLHFRHRRQLEGQYHLLPYPRLGREAAVRGTKPVMGMNPDITSQIQRVLTKVMNSPNDPVYILPYPRPGRTIELPPMKNDHANMVAKIMNIPNQPNYILPYPRPGRRIAPMM